MADHLIPKKIAEQLFDVVWRQSDHEIHVVTGVEDEVVNLISKMRLLRHKLQLSDVERRKLKDKAIGSWLEKLEDLVYEMEDVLDEWNTEIYKCQIEVPQSINQASSLTFFWDKVRSFFITYCLCCLQVSADLQVSAGRDIAVKIKELNNILNNIFEEAYKFNFFETLWNSESGQFGRPLIDKSTPFFDESEIRGRENDKDIIVERLISAKDDDVRVVSIVGMAGIGKTSLAQAVYNDMRVKDHFEIKQWVCVSNLSDLVKIARAILQQLEQICSSDDLGLGALVKRIRLLISRKKFLLVLDDLWIENIYFWRVLSVGDPGSRILVTTRSERTAHYMHSLNPLPDSDCWGIISRIASVREYEKFEEIGFEISRKCKGLPLAAKFLGNLLQSKDTIEQWQNVLESEIWELEEAATDLFPHLYSSYNDLSPRIKLCFLYCAVFPKDYPIDVQQLIRLWIAQGYISSSGRGGKLEWKGYEYFRSLTMHSFFKDLERDTYNEARIIKCKMHGIVHDFAQHLVNGKCLTIKKLDEAEKMSSGKVRHLTWFHADVSTSSMASHIGNLRSFCSFNCINIAPDLFSCLKCARMLSLHGAWLEEVPRAVGKLIHLRYLDLSRNNYLKELPEEICDLHHLETLDITDCPKVTQLPQRIGNLINLKYLLNSGTNIKQGLEELTTSLQVLKELKVGEGYNKLGCLRNLNQLGGQIHIEFFGEVDEANFDNARLRDKFSIQELVLMFYESAVEVSELPLYLKYLSIYFYAHSLLPNCIISHNKLRRLDIAFGNLSCLSALGKLPSLEILQLFALKDIEVLDREFLGITESPAGQSAFPQLKKLKISRLQNLRTWEDLEEGDESIVSVLMPCLQELDLYECHELKMLPHRLLSKARLLEVLDLRSCIALAKRYNMFADGWNYISHIPNVLIDGSRQVPMAGCPRPGTGRIGERLRKLRSSS